jgi:predicted amidohydrolase YtcJ
VRKNILFTNGSVFDGSRFLPTGTVVGVSGGRITSVGTADAVEAGGAEIVDLDGGTLLPGFIDSHAHPVMGGMLLRGCDLAEATTQDAYLEIIARYAAANPDREWITGAGWSMSSFPGGIPTRQVLDSVVPDRPVILQNRDHHGAWVNSKALELAGIDSRTLDPVDGRIERDADGEPVGMLQEGAMLLVTRLLPAVTAEDRYLGLLAGQDYYLSLGLTGWQDALVGRGFGDDDVTDAYLRAAGDGTLKVSVTAARWWQRHGGLEQLDELLHHRTADAVGRFRPTSVKLMLDGVAENHTAAMLDPYLDGHGCATDNSGLDFIDPVELRRFVTELDAHGFQAHFHALGDRAVRNALDAIEAARAANGNSGIRHHLAHLQVIHPDDIARFAALGASANIQPLWATNEEQMTELTIPFLGETRSTWQYPFADLARSGAHLASGSDWPVSSPDPLLGIHVAVNRGMPGTDDPFLPKQSISLQTALAAYTSGTALINGVAHTAGSVKVGYDADFAVVTADLSVLPDAEIGQASVRQTWIGGELAYEGK